MNGNCIAAGVIHACFIHCVNRCCRDVGLTGLGGSLWLRLLWMLPISVCELERERPSKYGLKDKRQRLVHVVHNRSMMPEPPALIPVSKRLFFYCNKLDLIDFIDCTDTYSDSFLGNVLGTLFGEEPLGELWKTQKRLLGTLAKLTKWESNKTSFST